MAQTEKLLEIRVRTQEALRVRGSRREIVMIPFTGEAEGPCFTGHVAGTGVDTQTIENGGPAALSARYMLEGRDSAGNPCRIFVENTGTWGGSFRPRIVTDSPLLRDWEDTELSATVEGIPGGVLVTILRNRKEA